MTDDNLAVASDATAETLAPEVQTESAPVNETPATSAREALERAFAKTDEQPRAPDGKWTKAQQDAADAGKASQQPAKAPVAPAVEQPATTVAETPAPAVAAPTRFSKEAQDAWVSVPEVVRRETERAITELQAGLQQYQERWTPLKQFDEMARAGGTDLPTALNAYVGMENEIRRDPVRGLALVCQNAGLDPVQVGQALAGMPSTGGASPDVAPLLNKISELERQISGVSQTFAQQQTMQQVEAFAAANPRFDELAGEISAMLKTGYATDLQDAYDKAARLHPPAPVAPPAIPAAPAATPAPVRAQTPKPTLQITGSPSGSDPSTRTPAGSASEAIRSAFARVGLN